MKLEDMLLGSERVIIDSFGNWEIRRNIHPKLEQTDFVKSGRGGEPALRAWLEKRAGSQPQGDKHGEKLASKV